MEAHQLCVAISALTSDEALPQGYAGFQVCCAKKQHTTLFRGGVWATGQRRQVLRDSFSSLLAAICDMATGSMSPQLCRGEKIRQLSMPSSLRSTVLPFQSRLGL